jgi:hypothetical protein
MIRLSERTLSLYMMVFCVCIIKKLEFPMAFIAIIESMLQAVLILNNFTVTVKVYYPIIVNNN